MTRKERLAESLLRPVNKSAIILLGVYTVLWGFWLANPFWTVFHHAALYSELAHVGPEWAWGLFAIFCGLITIRGAVKRCYRPLVLGAATAGWHWFMISIFYFLGDWQNTGGITSLVFAVYAAFIYLNIRVNRRENHKSMEEMIP